MTDLKFCILEEIYNNSSRARINEAAFYRSKGENFPEFHRAVGELRKAGYLTATGDDLVVMSAGITAMEDEIRQRKQREEDIQLQHDLAEKAAKDAKKARFQQWIAIAISGAISLIALIKSFL